MKKIIFIIAFFISIHLHAQTNLLSQNFDATAITLIPSGWAAISSGWNVDSTNFSSGYTAASGLKNLVIKNTVSTGIYTLVSPSFSTVGYSFVGVTWAARNSSNFETSGSNTNHLEYSIDAGNTWTAVSFTQNAANSTWAIVNNGMVIQLPTDAAGESDVRLRWTANIVNATQGTYRMDDVNVVGSNTAFTTGINAPSTTLRVTNGLEVFPNPCGEQLSVIGYQLLGNANTIKVYDAMGRAVVMLSVVEASKGKSINVANLPSGIYFIKVTTADGTISTAKFSKL